MQPLWDRHSILAEIHRRGGKVAALGKGLGRDGGDIDTSVSLHRPFPSADRIISEFIEVPLHALWPDRYDSNGKRLPRKNSQLRTNSTPQQVASKSNTQRTNAGGANG